MLKRFKTQTSFDRFDNCYLRFNCYLSIVFWSLFDFWILSFRI